MFHDADLALRSLEEQIDSVYVCSIAGGVIAAIHAVRNPDKLEYLKGQLRD